MSELLEFVFKFIGGLIQEVFRAVVEYLVDLAKRATFGGDGTKPNARRLFWFRVFDLLLAVYLGYGLLVLVVGFPAPKTVPVYHEAFVVVASLAFVFCFLVSLAAEEEAKNYRYVFLTLLAFILTMFGLVAWTSASP